MTIAITKALAQAAEHALAEALATRITYPSNEQIVAATGEELGEVCRALLEAHRDPTNLAKQAHVYHEAMQLAAMALRIAIEGSGEFSYAFDPAYAESFKPHDPKPKAAKKADAKTKSADKKLPTRDIEIDKQVMKDWLDGFQKIADQYDNDQRPPRRDEYDIRWVGGGSTTYVGDTHIGGGSTTHIGGGGPGYAAPSHFGHVGGAGVSSFGSCNAGGYIAAGGGGGRCWYVDGDGVRHDMSLTLDAKPTEPKDLARG